MSMTSGGLRGARKIDKIGSRGVSWRREWLSVSVGVKVRFDGYGVCVGVRGRAGTSKHWRREVFVGVGWRWAWDWSQGYQDRE